MARSSSFRYTSVRRNFARAGRRTGKHHLTWPSNTILLLIRAPRIPASRRAYVETARYIPIVRDTVIITIGTVSSEITGFKRYSFSVG